ncbi:MAG TPA: 30S ribosomal protein S1 [Nitrospirota bacterium]|nr:30S ribosomal protein S1 [Nitrospirota bacterium]
MDNNNRSANEANGEESFADMFEKSFKRQGRLEPGQMVDAEIVKISADWIFLDLGGKGEGYLDKKEMIDEAGNLTVKEGDTVRAYFISSENNEMHFTTKIGSGPGKQSQLEDAWRNKIPVEGTIAKEMKGGFEVKIGSVRAFCPFSQTGIRREENQADYIGKSLSFKIIEFGEDGRNIVLSRRAILDDERRNKKQELRKTLQEGMKVKGKVTSIQKFGAFVDIGGIEGLLPVSEIAWGRTEKVSDILSLGQEVEVIIKKLDWDQDRFSFSLKDALPDPWDSAADAYPAGSFHIGTVSRLAPFGAFVTLREGIDGLIHISKLGAGRRINHPREVLKEGQTVEVKIEAFDRSSRKLSLSLAEISREEEEAAATLKDYQQKAAAVPKTMGSLGDMLKEKMEQKEKK